MYISMKNTEKHKILVTDPLNELGLKILEEAGEVIYSPGMNPEDIKKTICNCSAMLVRSGTTVTKDIIEACSGKMKIIGRAGVGVDNIDVPVATQKGIIVVNSPDGNTTAAAEHTLAMMMALARQIAPADLSLKSGKWDRKKFMGIELRAKKLGVIGLGKIGSKVAQVAIAMGMEVLAYDPLASTEKIESLGASLAKDLDVIWQNSDFITLHIPKTPQTANLVNKETIAKMKDGVRIINCARGGVINEADLAEAIANGKVAGAAIDVFSEEPTSPDNPLLKLGDKVVVTPHLGASTEEAQINVSIDVAEQIKSVLTGGFAKSAVNLSGMGSSNLPHMNAYLELCQLLGKFLEQYAGDEGKPSTLSVKVSGELTKHNIEPLVLASLAGFLSAKIEGVSLVNAKLIAQEKGINIIESKLTEKTAYSEEVCLEVQTEKRSFCIRGILQEGKIPVITRLNERNFFLVPDKHLLLTLHNDRPGVIAKISDLLAREDINISGMVLGRKAAREEALMICTIDEPLNQEILDEVKKLPEVIKDAYIRL